MTPAKARDLLQRLAGRSETARIGWSEGRIAVANSRGLRRAADYFVAVPASELHGIREKFTYLGGKKQRWSQFDTATAVGWRIEASGQPGLDRNLGPAPAAE